MSIQVRKGDDSERQAIYKEPSIVMDWTPHFMHMCRAFYFVPAVSMKRERKKLPIITIHLRLVYCPALGARKCGIACVSCCHMIRTIVAAGSPDWSLYLSHHVLLPSIAKTSAILYISRPWTPEKASSCPLSAHSGLSCQQHCPLRWIPAAVAAKWPPVLSAVGCLSPAGLISVL